MNRIEALLAEQAAQIEALRAELAEVPARWPQPPRSDVRKFVVIGGELDSKNKLLGYATLRGAVRSTATLTALSAAYDPYAATVTDITDDGVAYGVDVATGVYVVVVTAALIANGITYCAGRLKDRDTPKDCEVQCLADPVLVPGPGGGMVEVFEAISW